MKTLAQRCLRMAVFAALATSTVHGHGHALASPAGAAPAPPSNPAPGVRPWLDVKLPAAPAPAADHATLEVRLAASKTAPPDYAGVKVWFAGAPGRAVRVGDRAVIPVAASSTRPLRLEIGGMQVLAHVRPGDTLSLHEGHDGGWVAVIGNRMNENAPRNLTQCGGRARTTGECPAGYVSTRVFEGDPVCPASGDDTVYKCVQAPIVRARGPIAGRAEVTRASADGNLEEPETVSLAPTPLAANALGPRIPIAIGSEAMPEVRLGGASAMLVVGPGQSYQVWLDDKGQIDSALMK